MDRLTIRKRNIVRIIGAGDDNQDSGELLRRCIKKLADYEDSGISPELLATIPSIVDDTEKLLEAPVRRRDIEDVRKTLRYLADSFER